MQAINAHPSQAVTPNQVQNTLALKDIHVPEQISNYPIAYGWWLLASLLIIIIVSSIIKIRKSIKRNQVKKQALMQLKSNPEISTSDTIILLKWAAMHYFSRAEVAKLFGNSLQSFLTSQLPLNHQKKFNDLSEQAFLNQYQNSLKISNDAPSAENLSQAAKLWLTYALPPKKLKVAKSESMKNTQGANA